MQGTSWRHSCFIFDFLFGSQNNGQEGGKIQKFSYFKSQKSVSGEIKKKSHHFFYEISFEKNKKNGTLKL